MVHLPRPFFFLLACLSLAAAPGWAQLPPAVPAASWLVYDRAAGEILASANSRQRWEPASLTKLMTAYVVFEAVRDGRLGWQQAVTAPEAVRRVGAEETRMYLRPGNRLPIQALVEGLLIVSANDAAITLASAVAGTEEAFVARMNATAARLGMTGTHFNNPSGIPGPSHYTTAEDLLRLTLAFDRDFPQVYAITRAPRFTFQQFRKEATNPLLGRNASVDGLKTGHTKAAGYNIVTSARRLPGAAGQERDLVAIVLGTPSKAERARSAELLLNYAGSAFHLAEVLSAGRELQRLRVHGSAEGEIAVGVEHTKQMALPAGTEAQLRITLNEPAPFAPLPRGAVLGQVEALQGERILARAPLVALQEASPAAWPLRLLDWVALQVMRWVS
ncbi:D-alanyl-D-alanine carboxypeptidase [Pseudoroseomonas wenyumeiae]|uniref:serine-type D-Ala-D-Ala carboxypeptidase n=1 Tax=Teichococcus wenyumeiae TaxID=2478470 RepID=A0A3A9JL16_9PROT|nr:D-alanyl-D-alanine carboxypeptidase family protein [Pseudoroseomonas wenyumeiae]RKK04414.1 D-alanyl-D-alanine carboxypeptidase [Pseudoroseomonas wenyumeiae]RMI19334.1 D-alanyl-D-alanine carboxypeptidase [Pseudoroseomonas wenyumeiae]